MKLCGRAGVAAFLELSGRDETRRGRGREDEEREEKKRFGGGNWCPKLVGGFVREGRIDVRVVELDVPHC